MSRRGRQLGFLSLVFSSCTAFFSAYGFLCFIRHDLVVFVLCQTYFLYGHAGWSGREGKRGGEGGREGPVTFSGLSMPFVAAPRQLYSSTVVLMNFDFDVHVPDIMVKKIRRAANKKNLNYFLFS